ncbi:arginine N-succinyltransferase [Chitinimonas naiadis]
MHTLDPAELTTRAAEPADLDAIAALRADFAALAGESTSHHGLDGGGLLVTVAAGRITPLACLRITTVAGLQSPRFSYHVGTVVHAASELGLFERQHTLLLGNDHTGYSELGDIAWDKKALSPGEQACVLQHLLDTALQLIADHRADYASHVMVELAGMRDPAGQAVFWQGMGKQFCRHDIREVRQRFGDRWHPHVASLLPKHAIYTSFLAHATQRCIAQAAPELRLLQNALVESGLSYGHHIRIDDAGPIFEAEIDMLPTVRKVRAGKVVTDDAA